MLLGRIITYLLVISYKYKFAFFKRITLRKRQPQKRQTGDRSPSPVLSFPRVEIMRHPRGDSGARVALACRPPALAASGEHAPAPGQAALLASRDSARAGMNG